MEFLTGMLSACLWARFGVSLELLSAGVVCLFFLLIAVIDLRHRLIPNALTAPAAVLVILLHLVSPESQMARALLGGLVGLAPFLLVACLRPGQMGGGDVKLAGLIGLMTGFPQVLWPVSLAIVVGALASLFLLLGRRWQRESRIPYAPFLCFGAIVSLLYNPLSVLFTP